MCPRCEGRAATIAILRKTVERAAVNHLWAAVRESTREGERPCPACERPMRHVALSHLAHPLHLDVCRSDALVWFDPTEFESLPPRPTDPEDDEALLPLEARMILAKAHVDAISRDADIQRGAEPPDEAWKLVPAFFGMPVEHTGRALARLPWATWMLGAAIVIFSLLSYLDLGKAAEDFGLIPADPWRLGGLTFLSSFFLHGSAGHLLTNLYFLLVFGDDAEDYLGSGRYLLVLSLSTVAGAAAHVLAGPNSTVPLIGASGGISGLILVYGLQYPRARISLLFQLPMFIFRWIHLRAWAYLLFWIALQIFGAYRQVEAVTQVSFFAHLGGAVVGLLYWFLWPGIRNEEPEPETNRAG